MKERIVLEKHELYKLLDCLPMPMFTDEDIEKEIKEGRKLILFGKERKVEQVPENFDDLKELCKQYNNVIIGEDYIQFKWHLTLFEKGYIQIDTRVVAFRRTPAQQWEVFKNLMEETNENKVVKQVVEMPDGEKRFNIVQELHKEGYRTIQETPNKVVLVKFVDE